MPSPVGHTLAGICGFYLAYPKIPKTRRIAALFTAIFVANSPDLDIFPGLILYQDPSILHRQATHSFIVAIFIGCLVTGIVYLLKIKNYHWMGLWFGGLYTSHIVLDLLVTDDGFPHGLQAFWPITLDYFISPLTIFNGFDYATSGLTMLQSMMTFNNLIGTLKELAILMPLVWFAWIFAMKATKIAQQKSHFSRLM
ncbi:MAG: metal-dependent hydrolase [Microcoleaceae cyanobacterium]